MGQLISAKHKIAQSLKTILSPIRIYQEKMKKQKLKMAEVRENIKFFSQFIKKGNLCFDIGANNGSLVEIFAELGGKVVAVEPQKENMLVMQKKFKNNRNIILLQKALAEKDGQGELLICDHSDCSTMSKDWLSAVTGSGRLPTDQVKYQGTQPVDFITLDSLIQQFGMPDFCKIDVEGYEYNVLKGLSQPINSLSFEFTPEFLDPSINCIKHLSKLGEFEFNYSVMKTLKFALPQWVSSKEMSNILLNTSFKISTGPAGDVYARNCNNKENVV